MICSGLSAPDTLKGDDHYPRGRQAAGVCDEARVHRYPIHRLLSGHSERLSEMETTDLYWQSCVLWDAPCYLSDRGTHSQDRSHCIHLSNKKFRSRNIKSLLDQTRLQFVFCEGEVHMQVVPGEKLLVQLA